MGKWRRPSPPTDYEVGYGRPPKSTRFEPGQSGNPKGRPRQQKTIAALLQQVLSPSARLIRGPRFLCRVHRRIYLGRFLSGVRDSLVEFLGGAFTLRVMAGERGELAISHFSQLAAHRHFGNRDAKLFREPLAKVDHPLPEAALGSFDAW